jgi:hypothetical protein
MLSPLLLPDEIESEKALAEAPLMPCRWRFRALAAVFSCACRFTCRCRAAYSRCAVRRAPPPRCDAARQRAILLSVWFHEDAIFHTLTLFSLLLPRYYLLFITETIVTAGDY